MKVKHLFLAAVAAVFTFAACQEKFEDLGEPNIDLSTATLEFEQGAGSQTITLNTTRAWKAVDVADWIVVDPAKGEASKDDQTVTIAVLENTAANRSCTIKFTCGIDNEYLTVNQKGPQGGPEEGDGSKEHPYLASQARAIASALESGAEDGPYYIKGYVKKFASKHEEGITQYGNALFYITDTAEGGDDDFYCYQVYYLGGKKFSSLDQIAVGDEVIVYGKITNYNGTYETVGKGAAYIYSLNGVTEGGDDPIPTDVVDATVSQVIEEQNTTVVYRLKGTVSRFNATYCSFDITDETGSIYVYSVDAATKEAYSSKLANGDTVTVEGQYSFYAKNNQHEIINAKITEWSQGEGGGGGGVDPITGDNLLTNGSFEDWTGAKPTAWDFTSGNATLTKVSDAKEGNNACEVAGDAQANKRLMSKSYTLLAGTYQVQAFIKGEGQYRAGYAKLTNGKVADTQNDYIYIDESPVQATADWTEHTIQFTLSEQTEVSLIFMNNKKGAGKSFIVDDVKLVTEDGGLVEGGDVPPTPGTIVDATVAEFNAASTGSQNYRLKGTVQGPINTQYGNFDLVDETGTVYVYGISNFAEYSADFAEGGTVTVVGQRGEYNGKIEVVNGYIEKYEAGQGGGGEGGDDDFTSSLENPASASAALAFAQTLADGDQVEAYVKGKISKIESVDTGSYGNATYWISDDGSATNEFEIFRGYYLDGAKFTSEDQIKVGNEVIVFGKIVNYKGNTPEMTSGSKIMYIDGQGGGGEGGDDDYANAEAKTVAEFLAAKDTDTFYKLTGTVSDYGAANCRFDLTDATGTVYVYEVKNASDWSSKIHNGGTITLSGKYKFYEAGNQEEVVEAYVLSYDASTETGSDELSHALTSGITWTLGENAYDNTSTGNNQQSATVNGQQVDNLLKLSTSKKAGSATLTIPAGCTKIGFYACGWSAADVTVGTETVSVKKNAGCTGNAPYTLELSDASDYYEVSVPENSSVTVSCPTRVLFIGINAAN